MDDTRTPDEAEAPITAGQLEAAREGIKEMFTRAFEPNASPALKPIEDFHLTPAEALYLRRLPRKRRLAFTAAFRRRNFKERQAVVAQLKAEFAREQRRQADLSRLRHSITPGPP